MLSNNTSIQIAAHALQPVEPSERNPALDILRGFALFGVLVAYALWRRLASRRAIGPNAGAARLKLL